MTNPAVADHAAHDRPDRRALLGAGVLGAALALAGSRTASASATGVSDEDAALAEFAIEAELAARDLYDAAMAAGASGTLWTVLRDHHAAYAQRLAGIAGLSADRRNDAVFDALEGSFTGATSAAALDLENTAAATHTELLAEVTDLGLAAAMASIAAMESRHAAVLAAQAGRGDDLDALFLNTATPLSPEA